MVSGDCPRSASLCLNFNFCSSSHQYENFISAIPKSRLMSGADSVLALSLVSRRPCTL